MPTASVVWTVTGLAVLGIIAAGAFAFQVAQDIKLPTGCGGRFADGFELQEQRFERGPNPPALDVPAAGPVTRVTVCAGAAHLVVKAVEGPGTVTLDPAGAEHDITVSTGYASGHFVVRSDERVRLGDAWRRGDDARPTLTVTVPATDAVDAQIWIETGRVDVSGFTFKVARVTADAGAVEVDASVLESLRAGADVGDVNVRLGPVASGTVRATSDVGSVTVTFPSGGASDVSAHAAVGSVTVTVPGGKTISEWRDGPGRNVRVQTPGYANATEALSVKAHVDVGDVTVRAV